MANFVVGESIYIVEDYEEWLWQGFKMYCNVPP
jgi:hypothetical protein